MKVYYKLNREKDWETAKLISWSGKCSSKCTNEWNTENKARKQMTIFDSHAEE